MTLVAGWDVESTGVAVDKDRIIEIAVIVYEWETWSEKICYVRRFNPQMKVHPKALAVHGIADADLVGMPTFDKAAPLIANLFSKVDLFVGHNVIDFDFPILCHELARHGGTLLRAPDVVDTMQEGKWACADGKQPTLGELCWALNVPYDRSKAHAAEYDVRCNLAAFRRGVELGYFKLPELEPLKEAA